MTVAQKKRFFRARCTAAGIVNAKAISTASPLGSLRLTLGMPRSKFARLLGRTERAVIDWESGKSSPQGLSQQRVHELQRLVKALSTLFDIKNLGQWFDSPN